MSLLANTGFLEADILFCFCVFISQVLKNQCSAVLVVYDTSKESTWVSALWATASMNSQSAAVLTKQRPRGNMEGHSLWTLTGTTSVQGVQCLSLQWSYGTKEVTPHQGVLKSREQDYQQSSPDNS